ncbi:hypothetical protein ABZP36_001932 [Zizania latifolia]
MLVASTAVDRLSCIALGIVVECDFIVQLEGAGRPVALAKTNATLGRVDLLCEMAGASIFVFLLSKNDPLTCVKLSCIISLCALPLLMNRLTDGIFNPSENASSDVIATTFSIGKAARKAYSGAEAAIKKLYGKEKVAEVMYDLKAGGQVKYVACY